MIQSLDVISIQWQTKMYSMLSISIIMMLYCYQETSPTQSDFVVSVHTAWLNGKTTAAKTSFKTPGSLATPF